MPAIPEPVSPCVGICTLDAANLCTGCGRTLDEIAAWSTADVSTKQAIVAVAARRLVMIESTSGSGEHTA